MIGCEFWMLTSDKTLSLNTLWMSSPGVSSSRYQEGLPRHFAYSKAREVTANLLARKEIIIAK